MYVYHRYTQGLYKYDPWNSAAKSWLNIQSGKELKNIIHPKKGRCYENKSKMFYIIGIFCYFLRL